MITNFDKYKQIQFLKEFGYDYNEFLQKCRNSFHDDAEYEVDWYINQVMDLYYNGGEVYRIVSLNGKKRLDEDNLGNHWVSDDGMFDRVYGNIEQELLELIPYVITAHVKPKSINVKYSLAAFNELPEEGEIYIENGIPEVIRVKKYKR